MSKITQISALEILDSRGNWTIETNLTLDNEFTGTASVPSGISVGSHEMKTVQPRIGVGAINGLLGSKLLKEEFKNQEELDNFLITSDGSADRSSLGANTVLSISTAFCKASALESRLPLYDFINKTYVNSGALQIPQPLFNVVNGGRHAKNDLDFQEFIIVPKGKGSFTSILEDGTLIFHSLGDLFEKNGFSTQLGDEGGYAPENISFEGVLDFITQAVSLNKLQIGKDLMLGIDAAASTLVLGELYNLRGAGLKLTTPKLQKLYLDLCRRFAIVYLEDPFGQDNFNDFRELKNKVSDKVDIVGDDLITTNPQRIKLAVDNSSVSAVIVKPNQIGTITETVQVINFARKNGIKIVASHRSGETDDSFIADFAVGMRADYIKAGAPARGERVAKYNRLLEIESEIGKK